VKNWEIQGNPTEFSCRISSNRQAAECAKSRITDCASRCISIAVRLARRRKYSFISKSRVHWVRPELVAEVKFLAWTEDNLLRQVVYEGLREDKLARDVLREVPKPGE